MRKGIVEILGYLVEACKETVDSKKDISSIISTRDSLLDILEERFRDTNSFTRAKVLQTWQYLYQ